MLYRAFKRYSFDERPNGEAQPPADEYGVVKRYGRGHELVFKNATAQPVGWSAMVGGSGRHYLQALNSY
jgi:hypothetical protein